MALKAFGNGKAALKMGSNFGKEGNWRYPSRKCSWRFLYKLNGAGEPNDSGGNEDCLAVLTNGKWNDYPCTRLATYVIEYDGSGVNSSRSFQVAALLAGSISLSDINKFVGDTPFDITNPTSSSSGAFSYTSSNNTVATVSGNTVTVLGPGTSTITVLQASDGTYDAASASATLTVSEGGPNDPEVAFEAIKANIEETSSDNVYKNSIEHLQSNETTLHEQIMFHSKVMEQKIFPSSDSTVDYNMSFVGKGYNIQGNGHYHRTDFMDDKIRRRVLVDAKKVFFKGDSTTTVFTSLLSYDYDFLTQNSKQLRLGLKRSKDPRNQTLKYESEAKTIFIGAGISREFKESVLEVFQVMFYTHRRTQLTPMITPMLGAN